MSDWDETTNVTDEAGIASPEQTSRDKAYLIVLAGSNVGEMFKLEQGDLLLGRAQTAEVRLLDDGVSRLHARIRPTESGVVVEDLESRNGTFCNGHRVTRQVLEDGDKIQIGRTTILKFTYTDRLDESFQQQMYDSALRDPLTKIYNKRYFTDRLESEFQFAKRHESPLSLLLLDLDHFKRVNDEHGHLAGDHVLATFAKRVGQTVRNEDVLARYGGEEFAIISRALDIPAARAFGERLRAVVESMNLSFNGQRITITTSIGIAAIPTNAIDSAMELIAGADRALYWAKAKGRNRVAVSDDVEEDETSPV